MAASVSTFVVSWKEAAERKLSVASDALVIPRMTCSRLGGLPAVGHDALVLGRERVPVDELAGQEDGVALRHDRAPSSSSGAR